MYSEEELRLIEYFDLIHLLKSDVKPVSLYQMMIEKAFLSNDQSKYANALRAAYTAFNYQEIYRRSEKFDEIIKKHLDN